MVLVFLLFVATAGLLFKLLNSPSEGVITYPDSSNQSADESDTTFVRYDGEEISFSYPEGFRFEKRQDQSSSVVESYFLVAPAKGRNPSYTVGLSVYRLPNSDLNEDGSYRIRNNAPQTYKKTAKQLDGRQVIYFENQTKPENTAFIQNGGQLAAIGISGALLADDANAAFSHLIESLEWL